MPRYLDEFIYRFNRRRRETELFGFVLTRAVRGHLFPYSGLTAELFGYAGESKGTRFRQDSRATTTDATRAPKPVFGDRQHPATC
ncbi:MAG TPA: hypothetical protein VKM54_22395 [Myxococcota bacterium]|nr:hypothetical protein [Myxococcota bacterium]